MLKKKKQPVSDLSDIQLVEVCPSGGTPPSGDDGLLGTRNLCLGGTLLKDMTMLEDQCANLLPTWELQHFKVGTGNCFCLFVPFRSFTYGIRLQNGTIVDRGYRKNLLQIVHLALMSFYGDMLLASGPCYVLAKAKSIIFFNDLSVGCGGEKNRSQLITRKLSEGPRDTVGLPTYQQK